MIINLIDKNIARVLILFSISPGSRYYRNEIKEKTGMNNVPLDNALAELLTLDILNIEGRAYFLNMDIGFVREIIDELRIKFNSIPLKVQFEILEFIFKVIKMGEIKKIILFGSYAKLIYSNKSDIDIALVLGDVKNRIGIEKKIEKVALKIDKKYKKEIEVHFFNEGDLKHKEDPLIKDILKNGRVLVG